MTANEVLDEASTSVQTQLTYPSTPVFGKNKIRSRKKHIFYNNILTQYIAVAILLVLFEILSRSNINNCIYNEHIKRYRRQIKIHVIERE